MSDDGEVVGLRFTGGPMDGRTLTGIGAWPPPDELTTNDLGVRWTGGLYRKVRQSVLPAAAKHVMRGAEYEWRPE